MTSSYIKMLKNLAYVAEKLLPVGLRNPVFAFFDLNWLKIHLTRLQISFCFVISRFLANFASFIRVSGIYRVKTYDDVIWWRRCSYMCIIIRIRRINYFKNDLKTFSSCLFELSHTGGSAWSSFWELFEAWSSPLGTTAYVYFSTVSFSLWPAVYHSKLEESR